MEMFVSIVVLVLMLITMSDPVWHCPHCRYQEKFKVEK